MELEKLESLVIRLLFVKNWIMFAMDFSGIRDFLGVTVDILLIRQGIKILCPLLAL